jgi:hypothetical protein
MHDVNSSLGYYCCFIIGLRFFMQPSWCCFCFITCCVVSSHLLQRTTVVAAFLVALFDQLQLFMFDH